MAITSNDIKLMQPQNLSDEDDGGGQMTGLEVIDGDINNLFEDISRIDRTYGNVSLRKAFLKVDTATADLYLDAHAILSAQPADPKVTGLLFTTDDFYDERADARQRVESFVIPGPVTGLYLRGTQLEGQKAIICYSPSINNVSAPEIGQTLMLQQGSDTNTQQFVKISDVTQTSEVFSFINGGTVSTFNAQQYILQLTSELKWDFPADDPNPRPNNASKIYSTQPANSAKYYGSTTLAASATAGATSIKVAETFAPIIPTASSETPVIDQRPGGYISQVVPSSLSIISVSVSYSNGGISTLPTAIVPGSVSVTVSGTPYTDAGGVLVNSSGETGSLNGTVIDYLTGVIAWAGSASSANETLSYQPGVLRQQVPNTGRIEIDDTNRNFNYVLSLDPPPAPRTFNASYMYLGKWYELQDNGTGLLKGEGSGQINYETGSVILTLQAQPDVDSVIFYRWTEGGIYNVATDESYTGNTPVHLTLNHGAISEGSVVITWISGGVERSATDINGVISGNATGTINYAEGTIRLTVALDPDAGTGWTVDYDHKNSGVQTIAVTVPDNADASDIVFATTANLAPGSLKFTLRKSLPHEARDSSNILLSKVYLHEHHPISDNGNGNLIDRRSYAVCGTVDYVTGQVIVAGDDFLKIVNV
ncbi:MAG TPA: hypothetical protein VLE50_01600 [Cellvibrio sp.]|nr:hypothetical protein [Cellvibrio sp.]